MRPAKMKDLLRAVQQRRKSDAPCIARLAFDGLPGFENVELEPALGFVALCGGTGVGKTALLELLYAALSPHSEGQLPVSTPRLGKAEVSLAVDDCDHRYEATRNLSQTAPTDEPGYPGGTQLVGLAGRTSLLQSVFSSADVEILKEGVTPYDLDKSDVRALSFALNKEYDSVLVHEVESTDDVIAPFFEVSESGVLYNSLSMSTGELSVFYLLWSLQMAAPRSILLIEEPEVFLPPSSHEAVYAMICSAALKKKLCVIFTTHSSLIASQVPDRNLLSIRRQSGRSIIPKTSESKARALARLGLGPAKNALLFVEDYLAGEVLKEALAIFNFHLVCNTEVIDAQGSGGIKRILEALPPDISLFSCIGVLDGDAKEEASKWSIKKKLLFLPFEHAIEIELLDAATQRPVKFGQLINRTRSQVEEILEQTRGQDHHERFELLCRGLHAPRESCVRHLFQA